MQTLGEKVIAILKDRKGFDGWWYGIDEDIQAEIVEELDDLEQVAYGPVCLPCSQSFPNTVKAVGLAPVIAAECYLCGERKQTMRSVIFLKERRKLSSEETAILAENQ